MIASVRHPWNPRCPFHEGEPLPNSAFVDADVVKSLRVLSPLWKVHKGKYHFAIWECPKCKRKFVIGERTK